MQNESNINEYYDGFNEHIQIDSTLLYERRSGRDVLVTIAVPTFKRVELLKRALLSAASQKTSSVFQILIVDNDHESDGLETIKFLRNLDVQDLRYYRNEKNIGMFGNWNRCLTLAEGEWITILNDDDLLEPEFLMQSLHHIKMRPTIGMIACRVKTRDERIIVYTSQIQRIRSTINKYREKVKIGKLTRLNLLTYFLYNPHHGSLGILGRTEIFRALGGFNSNKYPSSDYFLFSMMGLKTEAYLMNTPLATYRVLENESKNAEVAMGWVEQGLQLRDQLSLHMPQPHWLTKFYSKLMAIHTARYCKVYWGSNLDVNKALARVGLPNVPVYALLLISRVLLHAWPSRYWGIR